jgi:hypothetical protein
MTSIPAAAADAARRVWARASGESPAPEEAGAAAERLCNRLRVGLSRWIGADGYRSLLDRAVRAARADHPVLGGLSCLGGEGDEPGTAAALGAQSNGDLVEGMVALLATLIDLLSRIIGVEMAVRLVEQAGAEGPSPRRVVSTQPKRGPNARVD